MCASRKRGRWVIPGGSETVTRVCNVIMAFYLFMAEEVKDINARVLEGRIESAICWRCCGSLGGKSVAVYRWHGFWWQTRVRNCKGWYLSLGEYVRVCVNKDKVIKFSRGERQQLSSHTGIFFTAEIKVWAFAFCIRSVIFPLCLSVYCPEYAALLPLGPFL